MEYGRKKEKKSNKGEKKGNAEASKHKEDKQIKEGIKK